MTRRTNLFSRRVRTALVGAAATAVIAGVLPAIPAQASVTTLTLTGASQASIGQTSTYSGTLAGNGIGVPLQTISVLLDGTQTATASTATNGGYSAPVTFRSYGTHTVQAVAYGGTALETRSATVTVTVIAPPTPPTQPTDVASASTFLYQGANAPQQGVAAGTIQAPRAAVLHGSVHDRSGAPVQGATVTVVGHPEYGSTTTRSDGLFDLAVNGGQSLTVHYAMAGYLPVERTVAPNWRDYTDVPDVTLIQVDSAVTAVTAGASTTQVARGTTQTDGDGSRQATLLVPAGTVASMTLANGSTQNLSTLHVRATEYTVGTSGPTAMPATLPSSSAYTYAVDYTVDEAQSAGATTVTFNQPLATYTDNFLAIPVGTPVPAGYYDGVRHAWIPSKDGVVIGIVGITGGKADVDVTGDGVADGPSTLANYGITDDERTQLAQLYSAGKSLWRVQVSHFTPWDYNYPYGLPPGATGPNQHANGQPTSGCTSGGSIIGCQAQTLGETIPIAGTPFYLRYDTSRMPGYAAGRSLDIGLTGATTPSSLASVALQVNVAGRSFNYTFSNAPNQRYTFVWDGNDVYGRPVYGSATATIRIGYVYQAVYYGSSNGGSAAFSSSFAQAGAFPLTGDRTRQQITLWQTYSQPIQGMLVAALQSIGGWTLNVDNTYDSNSHTLYLGDGTVRSVTRLFSGLNTVAGNGNAGAFGVGTYTGDGGAATAAGLSRVHGLAVGPDGSLYVADSDNGVVRHIDGAGAIATIAGGGTPASGNGDGGAATSAALGYPVGVAVGPDGSLYIADSGDNRIRRVDPSGTISTFAGGGAPAAGIGDGGPATAAALHGPAAVTVGDDGTVYVADTGGNRIRKIDLSGVITTIAGGGSPSSGIGDGLPGWQATLANPTGVAVAHDGTVYIADSDDNRIRAVGLDGLIRTVAGTGAPGGNGDGGAATAAELSDPTSVSVSPSDGSVLICERLDNRVRRIDPAGYISRVAGTGAAGFTGDGAPPASAKFNHPSGAVVDQSGRVWIADTDNLRLRRIAPPLPGFSADDFYLPSSDGRLIYQFSGTGRQKRILDALTNAVLYTFGYDSAGQLTTIADRFGNTTTIARGASETPTGIDSPYGQHTALHVNGNGWLDTVTDPTNASTGLGYGAGGLLTSFTDPNNHASTLTYDALGRLTKDAGADGKSTTLTRTATDTGLTVTETTAEGRATSYTTTALSSGATQITTTYPAGTTGTATINPDGSQTITDPDGTRTVATYGPDPRWGMTVPIATTVLTTRPSGTTTTLATARTVTLSDPSNPLSLTGQTDTSTVGGQTSTVAFDAVSKTVTATSPTGRRTVTTLNSDGLPATVQAGSLAATTYGYDARGRLVTTTIGSGPTARTTTVDYGPDGYIAAVHGPLHTISYTRDADGHPTTTTLPDTNTVGASYAANGNITSVTPPGQAAHDFRYTSGNSLQAYQPPQLSGTSTDTGYAYNLDRQTTTTTLPDGRSLVDGYDGGGRLTSVRIARGTLTETYDSATGLLTSASDPSGDSTSYAHDGQLVTAVTQSGAVAGAVHYTYDDQHLTGLQVASNPVQAFGYNADGSPTSVNGLTVTYDPTNGYPTATSIGAVSTSTGYDEFGEPSSDTAVANGSTAYSASYTRDKLGRIAELTETIAGTTTTSDYTYDSRGRLTDVTQGGVTVDHYSYDANGNRTAAGSVAASYDSQDRLTSRGSTTYTYNATGQLTSATTGSATTTYNYDELGELQSVSKPDGTVIGYVYDGLGRRVGKKVNGTLVQGFLYGTNDQPLATTNGAGAITATYTYTLTGVPDLVTTGGVTYRVVTDHTSSPRLIVNTSTGAVAEHLDYDPYGNVIADSNPGFQPFGFTGGLYDSDTGLIHLGARDYDPATARWLTKDPTRFGGGDTNLYAYVGGDPINLIDPSGLCGGWGWVDGECETKIVVNAVVAPVKIIYNGFQREIYAYEHGCSYWDSVKYGIEGTLEGGGLLLLMVAAPEAAPEAEAAEETVNEGIYVVESEDGTYVGQSGDIDSRLGQHVRNGKFTQAEVDAADRYAVEGGKTAREVAEQLKIDELGGIDNLVNKVNPIGPRRFDLMPEGYFR